MIHGLVVALVQHLRQKLAEYAGSEEGWGVEVHISGVCCRGLDVFQRGLDCICRCELAVAVGDADGKKTTVDKDTDLTVRFIALALPHHVLIGQWVAQTTSKNKPLIQRDAVTTSIHVLRKVLRSCLQVHSRRTLDEFNRALETNRGVLRGKSKLEANVRGQGQWLADGEVAGVPLVVKPVGASSSAFFGALTQRRVELRPIAVTELFDDVVGVVQRIAVKHCRQCVLICIERLIERRDLEHLEIEG